METYILFFSGNFKTRKDLELFTAGSFITMPSIFSIKFIIEKSESIIVIFNSELDTEQLKDNLRVFLENETIKFYFLFNLKSIIDQKLPEEIMNMIYNETPKDSVFFIEVFNKDISDFDIDEILEKIEKNGIESLSKAEKYFLDHFKK
jgi:hypothetical protein